MSCVCGGDWQTRVAADEMATVLMNRLLIAGSRAVNCHAATLTCNYRGPSCIFITLLCILINNFELLFTSRRLFKSPLVPLKSKVVFLLGVWRGKNSLAVYASCFFSFFFLLCLCIFNKPVHAEAQMHLLTYKNTLNCTTFRYNVAHSNFLGQNKDIFNKNENKSLNLCHFWWWRNPCLSVTVVFLCF